MTTRFGIFVPQGWRMDLVGIGDPVQQWEAMTAVAKAADAGSWDSIWLYDHFHTVPEPSSESTFECWSATAALARDTHRVNIGQMVGCNGYRNPALYAKISSTVDVASHGRLYAGIGAGWYQEEWKAYGYEWPATRPQPPQGAPKSRPRRCGSVAAASRSRSSWSRSTPTPATSAAATRRRS